MKRFAIYFSVLFQVFLLPSLPVFAADDPASLLFGGLEATNSSATGGPGYTAIGVPALIGRFIQILLGLTGIIFLVIIITAGITYMTAAGDATKVEKAKKNITQSIIGLILIVGAYSISTFIIDQLKGAV